MEQEREILNAQDVKVLETSSDQTIILICETKTDTYAILTKDQSTVENFVNNKQKKSVVFQGKDMTMVGFLKEEAAQKAYTLLTTTQEDSV